MRVFSVLPSCGCTITAEELYKIDKTAMADVLAAERTREDTQSKPSARTTSPEGKRKEEDKEETKEVEEEGDEELSLELEEILKTCDAIQQTTSHVGGVGAGEGEEGEGEKGEAGEECVLMEAI